MEIGTVLCFGIDRTAGLLQAVVGDARCAAVAAVQLLICELHLKSDAVDPEPMEGLPDAHLEAPRFAFRALEVGGHFDVHGGHVPILGQLPHVDLVNAEDSRQPAYVLHCKREREGHDEEASSWRVP